MQKSKLSEADLVGMIKDYDGLIVRSGTTVTAAIIEAASQLKVIGRAGTGVDNIDCNAATRKGVMVSGRRVARIAPCVHASSILTPAMPLRRPPPPLCGV